MATPFCRHFGSCGGCDSQDVDYAEQLRRKQQRLAALLHAALGRRAPPVHPPIPTGRSDEEAPQRFRHKAAFAFGESGADRQLALGHYAADSQRIVPVVECPVHARRANQIAFALVDRLRRAGVTAAGPELRGIARHLIVRVTHDGREAVAMLVVTRNDKLLRPPIRAFLATEDAPDGFYLNVHDGPGPYMVGRESRRLAGRSHVRETMAGASFLISPTAFFQTNVEAAARIVELVLDTASDRGPLDVLDLFAGSGLFTMPLARRGHRVTAVEEQPAAVADAEANVRLNKLPDGRVRVIAARVERALSRLAHERFGLVILDPPRQGCPPGVVRAIFRQQRPPIAVYVSCNPEALAGDLATIVDAGYEATLVQPVDMFPHTPHIETVVRLEMKRQRRPTTTETAFPPEI